MEYFYGAKKVDKRYQVLLKGLSKKLGTPVRDNKGFLVWFRGEEKIGLIRMILPGTEKAGVGVAVNEKNFVLSNNRVDK